MDGLPEQSLINTPEKCRIVLRVLDYIESRPDGMARLELFLQDDQFLFGVADVAGWTGWSQSYIRQLCQANKLPHIPGKALKFVKKNVLSAVESMQRGGDFRKRRHRRI